MEVVFVASSTTVQYKKLYDCESLKFFFANDSQVVIAQVNETKNKTYKRY